MKFQSGDLAICETCGTQFDVPLSSPPKECRICLVSDVESPQLHLHRDPHLVSSQTAMV